VCGACTTDTNFLEVCPSCFAVVSASRTDGGTAHDWHRSILRSITADALRLRQAGNDKRVHVLADQLREHGQEFFADFLVSVVDATPDDGWGDDDWEGSEPVAPPPEDDLPF